MAAEGGLKGPGLPNFAERGQISSKIILCDVIKVYLVTSVAQITVTH